MGADRKQALSRTLLEAEDVDLAARTRATRDPYRRGARSPCPAGQLGLRGAVLAGLDDDDHQAGAR
jgi:hypothetical protein